jgi:hypothetical protein
MKTGPGVNRCLRSRARGRSAPSLIPPRSGQLKGKRAKLILLFHLKHLPLRLCKKRKAAEKLIRPKKRRENIFQIGWKGPWIPVGQAAGPEGGIRFDYGRNPRLSSLWGIR